MMSPCKDCTMRHPLCHSECEDYILYRDKIDKVRKSRQENSRFYVTGHRSNMRGNRGVPKEI